MSHHWNMRKTVKDTDGIYWLYSKVRVVFNACDHLGKFSTFIKAVLTNVDPVHV